MSDIPSVSRSQPSMVKINQMAPPGPGRLKLDPRPSAQIEGQGRVLLRRNVTLLCPVPPDAA